MTRITEEMVRRKAEHNNLEIGTLEELSLHQENIEKIEHLQNWCRHLEILLLQSNLISRIENLNKLKKLRYLNLALNNIERIENLEGLECLEKLDLTLNFIGDLKSAKSLEANIHLKCMILTGNPCTDYKTYRKYTISTLPQINQLDNVDISRSERILACQNFDKTVDELEKEQEEYFTKRKEDKTESGIPANVEELDDEEVEKYWNEPSKNTPEERVKIAKLTEKMRRKDAGEKKKREKVEIRLFTKDGRPLNINQPKIDFTLRDDEDSGLKILDLAVYR